MCAYISAHMFMYAYIYTCMYTHTYRDTYVHTHTIEFIFVGVYMVLRLTTLHWTTDEGAHSCEKLILLLPAFLLPGALCRGFRPQLKYPPSMFTCPLILPSFLSYLCSRVYRDCFTIDALVNWSLNTFLPTILWCPLSHRCRSYDVIISTGADSPQFVDLCTGSSHDLLWWSPFSVERSCFDGGWHLLLSVGVRIKFRP